MKIGAKSITASMCRDMLNYDPATGDLTWLPREGRSVFNAKFAGKKAFTARHIDGHLVGKINGTQLFAHRVCWAIFHGDFPSLNIDHVNGDPADNRIENLREATQRENLKNRCIFRNNTSGTPGVRFHSRTGKWRASIGGAAIHFLGEFGSKDAAIAARKAAESALGYHANHARPAKTEAAA